MRNGLTPEMGEGKRRYIDFRFEICVGMAVTVGVQIWNGGCYKIAVHLSLESDLRSGIGAVLVVSGASKRGDTIPDALVTCVAY